MTSTIQFRKASYSSAMCIGTSGKSEIAGMLATSHWRSAAVYTNRITISENWKNQHSLTKYVTM